MQFDPISFDQRQALRELSLHRDAVLRRFATGELNHLADHFVDRQRILPGRRLLDEGTDPADDLSGSIAVPDDASERLPRLLQIWRSTIQPAQRRLCVGDRCGEGLVDFMGDRGRELAHGGDAVRVRQLHLHLAQSLSGALTLGDILAHDQDDGSLLD